jgi:hypothetical protein
VTSSFISDESVKTKVSRIYLGLFLLNMVVMGGCVIGFDLALGVNVFVVLVGVFLH